MKVEISAAAARALVDAGVSLVTCVPGHGATEIFEAWRALDGGGQPYSLHEEVAYTMAHAAALLGKRSAVLLKAHGFAKAANSIVDSLAAGTTAGFVTIVIDDRSGCHSDSIIDATTLVRGFAIPHRVALPHDLYSEIIDAVVQSEKLLLPVALILDADYLGSECEIEPRVVPSCENRYERDPSRHLLCPYLAEHQHHIFISRRSGIDWQLLTPPVLPSVPVNLPPGMREAAEACAPVFEVFKRLRGRIVMGDTGVSTLFGFPPYHCVDICTHIGGSTSLALGAILAGYPDTWAVTGDFSFAAAGILGLIESSHRNVALKVLLFDNGRAEATGGQPIPGGKELLDQLLSPYREHVRSITDPADGAVVEAVLSEAVRADTSRIVHVHLSR